MSTSRCPVCRRPTDWAGPHAETKPFCSATCRHRDLLSWLGGGYAIPGEPIESTMMQTDQDTESE